MSLEQNCNVVAIQRCLEALAAEAKEAGYTMLAHIISFAANCAREEAAGPTPPAKQQPLFRVIKGGRP